MNDSASSSQTKSPEPVTIPVKEEIADADQSNNDVILETVDEPVVEDIVSNPPLNEEIPEVPLDISYNLGITSETGYMDEPDTQEATDLENVSTSLENMKNEQDLGEQLEIMKEPFDIQSNEMEEVDFPLDNLEKDDTIILKERNDIYYEMYYEARRKAKMAKEMALNCYLEAKNIKNTYMLNDLQESDSDENMSEM